MIRTKQNFELFDKKLFNMLLIPTFICKWNNLNDAEKVRYW